MSKIFEVSEVALNNMQPPSMWNYRIFVAKGTSIGLTKPRIMFENRLQVVLKNAYD